MFVKIFLSFIVLCLTILHFVLKKKYNYWKNRNVIYEEPSWIFGNYGRYALQREFIGYLVQRICKKYPNEPYIGAYYGTDPVIIIKDLDLVKIVLTKEFHHFNSRELMDYADQEPMTKSILFSNGENWKSARTILTPMFSSAKLKSMFPLLEKCCLTFEKRLDNVSEVEMRDFVSEFTMDTIVSTAFGVELNKMPKDNGFRKIGNVAFNLNFATFAVTTLRNMWPSIFYGIGLTSAPGAVRTFFNNLLDAVFKERDYKPSTRNDFVDMLLTAKENMGVSDEFLIGQSVAMYLAGYETSANTVSYILHELAKHAEYQDRVLQEVDDYLAKRNNQLDYDCTTELPFLDACFNEALRLYPVLGVITREVSADYTLPSGVVLERGTRVHIPSYYLQRNEELFPNANEFRPERFLPENKDSIKPYSFLPFGEGPRICVEYQDRVLQEVDDYLAKRNNQLDYDCTTELPFLDACFNEALRLYPVLGVITREVSADYTLPSGVVLERGTRVHIPSYYLQRNEELFPNANEFRPERFLPENKDSIKPYSFLPFGEGPRICVGSRFAKMQAMAGMITILKKYRVKPCAKTNKEILIEPKSISTLAKGGLWLGLEARPGWESRKFVKKEQ